MTAHVALCTFGLSIPAANSLKDKRQIVKSSLALLRNRFNVAVAEVGALNTFRRAEVAVVAVSNNKARLESIMESVTRFLEREPRWSLEDTQVEFL